MKTAMRVLLFLLLATFLFTGCVSNVNKENNLEEVTQTNFEGVSEIQILANLIDKNNQIEYFVVFDKELEPEIKIELSDIKGAVNVDNKKVYLVRVYSNLIEGDGDVCMGHYKENQCVSELYEYDFSKKEISFLKKLEYPFIYGTLAYDLIEKQLLYSSYSEIMAISLEDLKEAEYGDATLEDISVSSCELYQKKGFKEFLCSESPSFDYDVLIFNEEFNGGNMYQTRSIYGR